MISKRCNFDFKRPHDSYFRIKENYIECESYNTITKYLINDYVRNFEEEKFYIIEFTNWRYIYQIRKVLQEFYLF
ncbi:hypothetical protein JO40_01305 [Treponema putidum]|nr:hypothetical protein JO40_01305 [Treponema putidum]TWI73345.1 hypothetical protein JM98_02319 [Treponema putidum]